MSRKPAVLSMLVGLLVVIVPSCLMWNADEPVSQPRPDLPANIYVDASTGDDSTGIGTAASPFRTITRALQWFYDIAEEDFDRPRGGAPLVIHVQPGIYNTNLGEGVLTLDNVFLVGEGESWNDVRLALDIRIRSDCRLEGLECLGTISIYQPPVLILSGLTQGTVIFEDIRAAEILIDDWCDEYVLGIEVSECELGSVRANSFCGLVAIRDCHVEGGSGISLRGHGNMADVLVENNIITECFHGLAARGVKKATLRNNRISECRRGVGLTLSAGVEYTLGGNEISGCYLGILVSGDQAGGVVTLGGDAVVGNETYNVVDAREPYSGEFVIRGITWGAPQPSGAIEGPADVSPSYKIEHEGNRLVFSD